MAKDKNKKPDTRVCVPAPMPIQCPKCRSSKTTAANGVHYNLHFATRYEHRVCSACNFSFTAIRRMTAEELAKKASQKANNSAIRNKTLDR